MSHIFISEFRNQLHDLRKYSGTTRESVIREAFKDLLKAFARQQNLVFIPEYEYETPAKRTRYIDGALLYSLRVPLGYWEAKDEEDDLDAEIEKKKRVGYPQDNIIFEDSVTAVLIQNRQEVMRCPIEDTDALAHLLKLFFEYEREEIADFRKAVRQFQTDLPAVLKALREMTEAAHKENAAFRAASQKFLAHAKETINPTIGEADVREMLIQHILTEEIFTKVFDSEFHRENNVAKELYALEGTFFTGAVKRNLLKQLEPYYAAIRSAAALVTSHHEKQAFLKEIYEGFYKVYNRKAADRLGVVYTPNEIVRFMVEGAEWLCQKHFGKRLIDRGVEILDPATGTGTFICELIEHFRGEPPSKLAHKYREELHANEVAILPYYVANLNIEATYAAISGQYAEYPNLCFVDTLDNVAGLGKFAGHQEEMFGAVSEENVERIKRQNARKISVIIGNPPYNANQQNENENNKNREYPKIDQRIKATYIRESTAQKTKAYDMYVRFFRWASDRLRDEGVIAFVSNRSFIDKGHMDGFRKVAGREFNEVWIVDLKGAAHGSGEPRKREGGNVFNNEIRVGVSVSFWVRNPRARGFRIFYESVRDYAKADEKREFLSARPLRDRSFEEIKPTADAAWINRGQDLGALAPLASDAVKAGKLGADDRAIFKLFSLGVSTNRDEWVYDFDREKLAKKFKLLDQLYRAQKRGTAFDSRIKWSETLKRRFSAGQKEAFRPERVRPAAYRPFIRTWLYTSPLFIDRPGALHTVFPPGCPNTAICFSDSGFRSEFCVLAVDGPADLHFGASVDGYQQVPRYRFADTQRIDNITDWALAQFQSHYGASGNGPSRPITKDAIFHYVYGVLHDPAYRETYAQNLKREFPRIPFYEDFWRWADWGEALMKLHIGYETVEPWPLERLDTADEKAKAAGLPPKTMLKANREARVVVLDSETQLAGVPPEAWTYRLGNRSALEWILDQYKEKTPKDPTIREKFNTYRFADHKEKVIDLLKRVTRVSVETMRIVEAMRALKR